MADIIWKSVVLGLVQGLTEFLPVSSSGHLAFFQNVLRVDAGNAQFISLVLHLGTLVAVCVIFYKDIIALFKKPFKTLLYLVIATIPAAVFGVVASLLDIDDYFYSGEFAGILLAVCFLATAVVLFVTESLAKKRENTLPLCYKTIIPMGLAQAVAVLPGISRSGSTICAGTLAGGKSEDVAKFSFLMSIPVILGGFLLELAMGLYDGSIQHDFAVNGGTEYGFAIALGFITSALAGLFAIKIMLKAIKKANYKWFSLYLVLLSITCVVLHFTNLFYR